MKLFVCRLLSQFGNTCYCNSVLQALYFCRPFRENVLAYKAQQKKKENLLTCLADLFHSIATQKKKVGVIPPKKFISRLRKENGEKKASDVKSCDNTRDVYLWSVVENRIRYTVNNLINKQKQ